MENIDYFGKMEFLRTKFCKACHSSTLLHCLDKLSTNKLIAFNRKIGCLLSICDYSVIVDQGDWSRCYEEQCIIGKLVYGVFNYYSITDSY